MERFKSEISVGDSMKWNFFGMWLNSRIKYNPEKSPKGSWIKSTKWREMTEEQRQKNFDEFIRQGIIIDSVIFYLLCLGGILAVYNVWIWLV